MGRSVTAGRKTADASRDDLVDLCVNTLRMLSIDTLQQAASPHPGVSSVTATMASVLWTRHLRHNPKNPDWPDRDRFVLSAAHASALLYSLLFLTGYDLRIEDLEHFRQWKSRTPALPERECTPGVEVTTGLLGEGFAQSVGFAIAERWLAATFNRHQDEIVGHYTYVFAGVGDLMEGVTAEAASLAATLRLGRLIVLFDPTLVPNPAAATLPFSEDVKARFDAYGWHAQRIDGHDPAAVDAALTIARAVDDRPSLVMASTSQTHGAPLEVEDLRLTRRALGWPEEGRFYVAEEALCEFRNAILKGSGLQTAWQRRVDSYRIAHPTLANEFEDALCGRLPAGWEAHLPIFTCADNAMATRGASRTIINALAGVVPHLVGASADLNPSSRTAMKGCGTFECPVANEHGDVPTQDRRVDVQGYAGRNIHCGLREHAMTAVMTGMALHRGLFPYGATLLSFSDCMRSSIRLAALSKARVIYLWTHDSIAIGEDGPTHQPVEQLACLRAVPNLMIIRPSDATETVEAWRVALLHTDGPVGLILTRQKLPVLDRTLLAAASSLAQGGYVLVDPPSGVLPDLILIATGSEVSLALEAHARLTGDGIQCRVVSMPCWQLFDGQPQSYRNAVLPPTIRARVSIEAASAFGWERYTGLDGASISVKGFGASAPGPVLMREFGFTPERVVETAKAVLNRTKSAEVRS